MIKVQCPKCHNYIQIDIAKAVDEFGEEFRCTDCGFVFRYAKR